jgi:AraC family transcriptional regulator of arabinose operon
MKRNKELLIRNYLSNMQVDVEIAGYTYCPRNWADFDYLPDYNKFYYICEGEGWLKIGENEYYPKPGQLFLMPAGVIQSYSAINDNTFKKYWCHFTAKIGGMNLFDIVRSPVFVDVPDDSVLRSLFSKLVSSFKNGGFTAGFRAKGIMIELIAWYFDSLSLSDIQLNTCHSVQKLGKVLAYIEAHIMESISIEDLAQLVHFHPNYFIRFFREHLGCSPVQYINKLRLEKAKYLLRTTELTIKEITDMIGFNDPGYFSKMFRKHTGFSPLEFRNIIKRIPQGL